MKTLCVGLYFSLGRKSIFMENHTFCEKDSGFRKNDFAKTEKREMLTFSQLSTNAGAANVVSINFSRNLVKFSEIS